MSDQKLPANEGIPETVARSGVQRTDLHLHPDPSRVMIRFFPPHTEDRIERVAARVMSLDHASVRERLDMVMGFFKDRHHDILPILLRHYERVSPYMITDLEPSEERKLLIGAYFTSEFALESAALFNPSIVPHPDQSRLKPGELRIVLSLRAIGEGHRSSLEFRSGVIGSDYEIRIDTPNGLITNPHLIQNPAYEKRVFERKLYELERENEVSRSVLAGLDDEFTFSDLIAQVDRVRRSDHCRSRNVAETLSAISNLAVSIYDVGFDRRLPMSERVIVPHSGNERKGIEDARFVMFQDDEGARNYYATYTACDGSSFLPQLLETADFTRFRFITLNGEGVSNKGMALFPRPIKGRFAMLSRQDNENIYLMYSEDIHFWNERKIVMKPSYPWEFVQTGNCGSPIEIDEGWLVLTHGVGAMRRYCIGAILLDKEDPTRVIGRLKEPLLEPDENERQGYVPNVVYTCGAMVHQEKLILPYAMSDYATTFALVDLKALLESLR